MQSILATDQEPLRVFSGLSDVVWILLHYCFEVSK